MISIWIRNYELNRDRFIETFVDRHNWIVLQEEHGHFSVTPDQGDIKRVFRADVKHRKSGTMLLGTVGIAITDRHSYIRNDVELCAYITNLEDFSRPPLVNDSKSVQFWIDKIVNSVERMPVTMEAIKYQISMGFLGDLPVDVFLNSSPKSSEFLNFLDQAEPC